MLELRNDGWMKCPPGELDRLANRLGGKRRSQRLTNAVAAIVSVAVLVGMLSLGGIVVARACGYTNSSSSNYPAPQAFNGNYCPAATTPPAPATVHPTRKPSSASGVKSQGSTSPQK
jgi:hypothetical protein